jgi:hypothetical protein
MPPKRLEPEYDDRGRGESGGEHDAKRCESQIPARRKPRQLLLNQVEFLHYLRVGFSGLIGLTEGEAVGFEVGHVACIGLARDHK